MRRRISSAQTYFQKFVVPVAVNVSFAYGLLWLFGFIATPQLFKGQHIPANFKWVALAVWIYANLMLFFINYRIKRVEMDDENLYISNYMDEITVPLSNVANVTESRWMNPRPVTLHFHEPTEFGNRVVFLSKQQWFESFWKPHPIVGEIREAIARKTPEEPA